MIMRMTVRPLLVKSQVAKVKTKMSLSKVISRRKLENLSTLALTALYIYAKYSKKSHKRRYWVRPFLQARKTRGDFYLAVPDMIKDDPEYYFQTFRMTPDTFDELLTMVGSRLKKENYGRESISPGERLQLTLAYLVSGDQQKSIAKNYRMGRSTVCTIIRETCQVIFEVLQPNYLQPPTKQEFGKISQEFENQWQFPHCLGAVDGKHFAIPAPPNSGSRFYNYKGFFSVVLLAVCDANYNFILCNCGAAGSESDGGIFRRSEFGKQIVQRTLDIPSFEKINGTDVVLPYCFVGDEAFPLLLNLMRPFPGDKLEISKRIFNYRLSRARRIIENSFGILVARWRILSDTINVFPENAVYTIYACIVLHNFVRAHKKTKTLYIPTGFVDSEDIGTREVIPGAWRQVVSQCTELERQGTNNYNREAAEVREMYKDYFSGVGAVPWQMDKLVDY